MNLDYKIRLEQEKDYREVENLTREAFWNVYRPGCLEHYVLHQFRKSNDFVAELDFLLEKQQKIIAHVMYAKASIQCAQNNVPIVTFGPLSVLPKEQGKGYGSALVRYSLEKAKELGFKAVAITGNLNFYGKLGFELGKDKNVVYADDPEAEYFLVKELEEGFLEGIAGTYKDPQGYFVDEQEAEIFDLQFPKKEKLKTDSQL